MGREVHSTMRTKYYTEKKGNKAAYGAEHSEKKRKERMRGRKRKRKSNLESLDVWPNKNSKNGLAALFFFATQKRRKKEKRKKKKKKKKGKQKATSKVLTYGRIHELKNGLAAFFVSASKR